MTSCFPILILNARPAAGKSETIRFLKSVPLEERRDRYHLGPIQVFDDFPMLWTWFEEDSLLETVFHRPRLHTTPDEYFLFNDLWHLLIRRLSFEFEKWQRDAEPDQTAVIEFSRGAEHDGYRAAFEHLSEPILKNAACMYINVSFEESLRRNRRRYNPQHPDSVLEHTLSDEKMERIYRFDDWETFSAENPRYLSVGAHRLPYVVFENEDDVTAKGGPALGSRLQEALDRLWLYWSTRGHIAEGV